jgi:hypothetical protein
MNYNRLKFGFEETVKLGPKNVSDMAHGHPISFLREKLVLGFEVLTAVSMNMAVFWVVAPCRLLPDYTELQPNFQR